MKKFLSVLFKVLGKLLLVALIAFVATFALYITNGENIYPAEVEDAIMRFPGVMMCACVAVPHEIAGEIGRAYIVPLPGNEINVDDLKEFLKEYLASYKIPREYVFRDMLPMTMLGKIEKKILRQEVEAEMQAKKQSK